MQHHEIIKQLIGSIFPHFLALILFLIISIFLLLCQAVAGESDESTGPAYEVFLQLAESKVKVADILNCESFTPESFEVCCTYRTIFSKNCVNLDKIICH